MLPAAGVFDGAPPEDAGGAVEIEKVPGPGTRSVLKDEMTVEQHRLHFGQEIVVAIEVAPAGLHHSDRGVGEEVDCACEEIGRRHEIRIEDRDQFASGRFEPSLQRPGLESVTIGPVMILDRESQRPVALHQRFGKRVGIVGGIVQHLNLQQSGRIFDLGDFIYEPLHYVTLVIYRKLDSHRRQLLKARGRMIHGFLAMLEIGADHVVPVQAVHREYRQNGEVRNQQRPVEPAQLVDTGERGIEQALCEVTYGCICQQCDRN